MPRKAFQYDPCRLRPFEAGGELFEGFKGYVKSGPLFRFGKPFVLWRVSRHKGVLAELDIKRKSHHAAWGAFGEHVTAPGLIDKRFHRDGWDLFNRRLEADYMAEPPEGREDAEECLFFAAELVAACRSFLENRKGV